MTTNLMIGYPQIGTEGYAVNTTSAAFATPNPKENVLSGPRTLTGKLSAAGTEMWVKPDIATRAACYKGAPTTFHTRAFAGARRTSNRLPFTDREARMRFLLPRLQTAPRARYPLRRHIATGEHGSRAGALTRRSNISFPRLCLARGLTWGAIPSRCSAKLKRLRGILTEKRD
mgnify:CR=1 FL=1